MIAKYGILKRDIERKREGAGMRNKVTIDAIAERLGLSQATVSRALNDKYGVSDATRKQVLLCAYELRYDFSALRRTVSRSEPADCVCVILKQSDLLDRSFYGDVLYGIENYLKSKSFSLYLCFVTDDQQARVLLDDKRFRPDGYIVMGRIPLQANVDIYAKGTPIVLLDPFYADHTVCRVGLNNVKGGDAAAQCLIRAGHTRVAFVGNPAYSCNPEDRYEGFRRCVEQYPGVRLLPSPAMDESLLYDDQVIRAQLTAPDRPTGVFCANDRVAFRVYEIARELGLRIPDDLSVVGFDDVEKCDWVTPRLTSVHVPRNDFGRIAAQLILENIADPATPQRSVVLETGFTERDSVAGPPS